jgi:alpha-ketoglutarate-dependent taurine dioxygenase
MSSPFNLDNCAAYARWREAKLAGHPRHASDLVVDVGDPRSLTSSEHSNLLALCTKCNMALYRSPVHGADKGIPRRLAAQLGLRRLDANWLADDDGISPITVAQTQGERGAFIPYTNRAIKWHTDGYYQPLNRSIQAMVLHCVRPASAGGATALMDPEMAYIAVRDVNPDWIRALCEPDAMTIPARLDDDGVARAEQSGPVFSVHPESGHLHMRYTARTRSIVWKDTANMGDAVAYLSALMDQGSPYIFRLTLEAGMGLVSNNVLHDRSSFQDDPKQPRLLYRARYLDRIRTDGV